MPNTKTTEAGSDQKTLTRMDLAEAVYHEVGLTRKAAQDMVDQLIEELCKVLEKGGTVKLSAFGNFSVRQKRQRMGRNPKTGVEVPITPRRVLSFRASHLLKQEMNTGGKR
jgi:integration host factor subunit alpha